MQIRRLVPADAQAFHRLRLAALKEAPHAFGASLEEEQGLALAVIEARLAVKEDRGVFGAFEDGALVGLVALGREDKLKLRHKATLWGLYVAPAFRGRGIARALLHEALALARSVAGVKQLNLSVNARSAHAIGLYEAMGFEAFGREPRALLVDGEWHDEVHMSLGFDR